MHLMFLRALYASVIISPAASCHTFFYRSFATLLLQRRI
ncbi:hypothetical protein BVRB_5g126210 [Beta vulgaris subsp. vulgaris]|uniref:Uncharacterized protein n=1 Tax=Beta vulgaris subsp. vulgaris TaxID=3555 RepID=A0A0J8BBY8_BETVV|nr:hypothetical protein BVRB_5g126210 [Beta vulgaris subsp. vulgaris]